MKTTKREAAEIEKGRRAFEAEFEASRANALDHFQAKAVAAFDRVAASENWKGSIDRSVVILPEDLGFLLASVVFFTGSVPEAEKVGRGLWRVRAEGYYAAVGA